MDLYAAVADEGRWIGAEPPVDREAMHGRFAAALAREDVGLYVADASGVAVGQLSIELHGRCGICSSWDCRWIERAPARAPEQGLSDRALAPM